MNKMNGIIKSPKKALITGYSLIGFIIIGLILAALGGETLALVGAVLCLGSMAILFVLTNLSR